jgi:uncharacterized membrane protein
MFKPPSKRPFVSPTGSSSAKLKATISAKKENTMAEGGKKVLKWILIGCGTILVLVIGGCAIMGYACKSAVSGMAGKAMATAVEQQSSVVVAALPEGERTQAKEVLATFESKAKNIKAENMQEVSAAMQAFQSDMTANGNKPSVAGARKFVADLKAISDKL